MHSLILDALYDPLLWRPLGVAVANNKHTLTRARTHTHT
jgi:hypothetical protein